MEVRIKRDEDGYIKEDNIVIDPEDTWDADVTLAKIAVPLIEQIKRNKQGFAHTDKEDVPERFHDTYDNPDNCGASPTAWAWVLDEMLWALNEVRENGPNHPYNIAYDKGVRKFTDADRESWNVYEKRVSNGCMLFGKYLRALWD